MDPFSDLLKPQKQGSNASSNANSSMSTPARSGTPQNASDSFASLASLAGAGGNYKKNMSQMSLQERQKLQSELSKQSTQDQNKNWSGLDLLGGGLVPPSSSVSPSVTSPSPSSSLSQSVTGDSKEKDQNIDDIFDVFNKPPPPPAPKQSTPPPPKQATRPAQQDARAPSPPPARGSSRTRDRTRETPPPAAKEDPRDGPIAELVDMGFTAEQAREALANTDNGLNIGQAIDYLMKKAHQNATKSNPVLDQEQEHQNQHQRSSRNQGIDMNEVGKMAQQFSATFLTKANKFWNEGRKNVAKAIEQYQQEGRSAGGVDDNRPAWMKDAEKYKQRERANLQQRPNGTATQEASQLDVHSEAPKKQWPQKSQERPPQSHSQRLKQNLDTEEVMYSSRARRTPPTKPSTPVSRTSTPPVQPKATPPPPPPPVQPKKQVPARAQPSISPTQLDMINDGRKAGAEAYKRGDYSKACDSFSQALESIPPKHLLRTILLADRAACHLLGGDPKQALQDSDSGIFLIGSGMGVGEKVDGSQDLKTIWSKLVTKKAESCEQLEKYKQAKEAWDLLMNNGFSNKQALEGRRRCQAALDKENGVKPKPPTAAAAAANSSAARGAASNRAPTSKAGREAVDRIKNANKQAEQQESEKYELLDSVEGRITAWRQGKEDNLRALLASLDDVLWPELQWQSVSMAQLVIPKKVKIAYMKAVAKTHPDKISTATTTEQKMIANAVFITLNTAWEGFKQANGLA